MWIESRENDVVLHVFIVPKSSHNEISGVERNALKVRIAAPPEKGEANEELVAFFSDLFHISKSRIQLLRGHASRYKKILLKEVQQKEILKILVGT